MTKNDPAFFHKLYGEKQKARAVYYKKDFLDYLLMILLSTLVVVLSYGFRHIMSIVGVALCSYAVAMFITRHGVEFKTPIILARPQEILYMFLYKLQNVRLPYLTALGLLLLENFLIAATPNLPHHVELMRKIAFYLFYVHFLSITLYRTISLIDHLAKKELVREVLMQTPWQTIIKPKTNMIVEIMHAYCTGVLTHIVLIAPWYLVICYFKFSVIFLPVVCAIDVIIHHKWVKVINQWFYRDHWLGHNSEFDFVFLHGPHHDAIPSGLIAVAENGFLEGFLRYTIAFPSTFYNPVIASLVYTYEIETDIYTHQYVPGIFPQMDRNLWQINQHSTHHYGRTEPYGFAMKLDQPGISEEVKRSYGRTPNEIMNSYKLDEELTGFKWDNPTYRQVLSLYDKYHK
jgi:hypothetical protein